MLFFFLLLEAPMYARTFRAILILPDKNQIGKQYISFLIITHLMKTLLCNDRTRISYAEGVSAKRFEMQVFEC